MTESGSIVHMRRIHKSFGVAPALRRVDLILKHKELLGPIGDNAAGKTTLMKVVGDTYILGEGEIHIGGQLADIMRRGRRVGDRSVEGDIHTFREEIVAYVVGPETT